jgi:hypothetical protein
VRQIILGYHDLKLPFLTKNVRLWGIDQATFDGGMLQQAFLLLLALTGKALGG